jgi:hypothetical protein
MNPQPRVSVSASAREGENNMATSVPSKKKKDMGKRKKEHVVETKKGKKGRY